MRKLMLLFFCAVHLRAMEGLTPAQLQGANVVAMRLIGECETTKKELVARVPVPVKALATHESWSYCVCGNNEFGCLAGDGCQSVWHVSEGHLNAQRLEAYNPDNKDECASVVDGGRMIRIWNSQDGSTRLNILGGVRSVVYNPHNANELACISGDGILSVWNLQDYSHRKLMKNCRSLVYSPYIENELVSVSSRGTLRIWNTQDRLSKLLMRDEGGIDTVVYSPHNDSKFVSRSDNGTVCIWNLAKRHAMQQLFSQLKNNVLPVESFMQKDSAGNERRIAVDPKVLLVLMHKLDAAFKNQDKGERVVLTPQELAYLSNVIFENGDDVRQAVGDLVVVEKRKDKTNKKRHNRSCVIS